MPTRNGVRTVFFSLAVVATLRYIFDRWDLYVFSPTPTPPHLLLRLPHYSELASHSLQHLGAVLTHRIGVVLSGGTIAWKYKTSQDTEDGRTDGRRGGRAKHPDDDRTSVLCIAQLTAAYSREQTPQPTRQMCLPGLLHKVQKHSSNVLISQ